MDGCTGAGSRPNYDYPNKFCPAPVRRTENYRYLKLCIPKYLIFGKYLKASEKKSVKAGVMFTSEI